MEHKSELFGVWLVGVVSGCDLRREVGRRR